VLAELPQALLLTGDSIDYWAAVLFLVSILAIMLSTVDSVLMAAMFTFMRDIVPIFALDRFEWLSSGPAARRALWRARIFGALLLLAGVSAYIIIDVKGRAGDVFIGALFAFYTAQLSMLPLVLGAMFLRTTPPGHWVLPGLILSVVAGIGLGLYATFARPDLVWWPVPVCLGMSFGLYGVALILKKRSAPQPTALRKD
jgi:Na+/proline symporter